MKRTVITVGTFDGVHRGHQEILRRVDEIARAEGLERVAYTFVFPPRFVLKGSKSGLLLPEEVKVKLLEGFVDRVIRANFHEVGAVEAEQFAREVLIERLAARTVVVGDRFRFGRDRDGDVDLLYRIGEEEGVAIVSLPPLVIEQAAVSSTRIRSLLRQGMVDDAMTLLGRPPLLFGRVVHGDRVGRRIGYPTANLELDPRLLQPATGVYLVHAFFCGEGGAGMMYIGDRPTVDGDEMRCEVYLFSPPLGELYGERMEVHLLHRIREDRRFSSLSDLRLQIDRDAERARALLPSCNVPQRPIHA
ncbi:MAG: riboflavin biosynthesis protein RibF [Candidatus Bipolaricaulota bacterium]|nr:riboflavin biosynthesis protein RibF [Candidatus Bipolaricaulota bacterium]